MSFYLLYNIDDRKPYSILTFDGKFSEWHPSMEELLSIPLSNYTQLFVSNITAIQKYLDKPKYPIINTFTSLPTKDSHPELFL